MVRILVKERGDTEVRFWRNAQDISDILFSMGAKTIFNHFVRVCLKKLEHYLD